MAFPDDRRYLGADRLPSARARGHALVDRLLAAPVVRVSAGPLLETRTAAERDSGKIEPDVRLEVVGVEVVPVDARQVDFTFEGFSRFGRGRHPAVLDFGDVFAHAPARAPDQPLLSEGHDFVQTDVKAA